MSLQGVSSFFRAPLELQAFASFCLITTVLGAFAPTSLRSLTVAFTGWNPAAPYMFCGLFAFLLIYTRRSRYRLTAMAVLALAAAIGLAQWALADPELGGGNPYLQVHPLRLFSTVVLPLLWVAVLASRRIRAHCQHAPRSETGKEGLR